MSYQAALDAASAAAFSAGVRVLQGFRLAPSDEGHVSALLSRMLPPRGASILDVGCGFGEVARLMKEERPDLDFILMNSNALQLSYAPVSFRRIQADMHAIPLRDGSVDGLMYCYALCHADFPRALHEAARVARTGAELFVFDYARERGDNSLMRARLYASAIGMEEMDRLCANAGWLIDYVERPSGSDRVFRDAYADDRGYEEIFDDLTPVIWKARRV